MRKIARSASGLRHLRWAREIAATLEAHAQANHLLTTAQEQALAKEASRVKALVLGLRENVKAYRDFLESAHVESRARIRVARLLCGEALRRAEAALRPHRRDLAGLLPHGFAKAFAGEPLTTVLQADDDRLGEHAEDAAMVLRGLPSKIPGLSALADDLEKGAAALRSAVEHRWASEEARRRPLKAALERAIGELREGLEEVDGRLRGHFPQAFLDNLYPGLTEDGSRVADGLDEDDDASAHA